MSVLLSSLSEMIQPDLVPISDAVLPDLHQLFDDCEQSHVKEWVFNPRRCVVAVWKGEVVGFVASWWDGQPFAWVDLLLVSPKYRHQGVGVYLCGAIEALLLKEGIKGIRVVLDEAHGEMARILTRMGGNRMGSFTIMEKVYHEI